MPAIRALQPATRGGATANGATANGATANGATANGATAPTLRPLVLRALSPLRLPRRLGAAAAASVVGLALLQGCSSGEATRRPDPPAARALEQRLGSMRALDTPAREALLCLSRQTDGFQAPSRALFEVAIDACKASTPVKFPGEAFVERTPMFVDTVGRALGREALSVGSRFTAASTRALAVFQFESSVGTIRAFVGFSADVSKEFGQYEFIFERMAPKSTGPAPFTDYFVVKNAGAKASAVVPQPDLCEACHHQGQALFSVDPWPEMSARGAFRETRGNTFNDPPRFFEDSVRFFNRLVNGRRYNAWLGAESFTLRKLLTRTHLVSSGFLPPSAQALSQADDAALHARFLSFPPSESSILPARDPRAGSAVALHPGSDPLISRLSGWYSVQPHTVLEGSPLAGAPSVVEDMSQKVAPSRREEFVESEAFARMLTEHWPPSAEQLRVAADAFARDPRRADPAAAEKTVASAARAAATEAADSTEAAESAAATAGEAFDRYCLRCHYDGNGLVPALDMRTLATRTPTRGYNDRTAANLIANGAMPPGASAETLRDLDALRAALPSPTVRLDLRPDPNNQPYATLLRELGVSPETSPVLGSPGDRGTKRD